MFNFNFFKRKINKKAISQPRAIKDYYNSYLITSQDSTSFACIDRIATEFASLNFGFYNAKTRQKIKDNSLYKLIKQPNLEDSHFNFFYQSAVDYFNGGCFWLKIKVESQIVSLFRLNPHNVKLNRNLQTNKREFLYNGAIYTDDDIIYIPSRFNYSTKTGGQSIFDAVSTVFQTSRELDNYTQSTFKNGLQGKRTVIDVSGAFPELTREQAKAIKDNFQSEYAGAENSGRPLLKKNGIEYSELGANVDNRAGELTENRKFQEHEIAKIFGIPESLLNVSSEQNLENIFTLFLEFAIKPLAIQFQEAINSMLDEDYIYFEFDFNGFLKVSFNQRIEAYIKQISNGLLSPNEARQKENLEPIEAGDNYFMPVNLMPLNDDTINAYMAKQKKEIENQEKNDPTNENAQHFGGGDDKQ